VKCIQEGKRGGEQKKGKIGKLEALIKAHVALQQLSRSVFPSWLFSLFGTQISYNGVCKLNR